MVLWTTLGQLLTKNDVVGPNAMTRQLSISSIKYYVYWSQLVQIRLSGVLFWTNLGIMVFVGISHPLLCLTTDTLIAEY
jgi:hypothetical protein